MTNYYCVMLLNMDDGSRLELLPSLLSEDQGQGFQQYGVSGFENYYIIIRRETTFCVNVNWRSMVGKNPECQGGKTGSNLNVFFYHSKVHFTSTICKHRRSPEIIAKRQHVDWHLPYIPIPIILTTPTIEQFAVIMVTGHQSKVER